MKKTFQFLIFILIINSYTYSQEFNTRTIYIIGRGTLSKRELIGQNFNVKNENLTHLGIGLVIKDTLRIYNVSNDKTQNKSALIVEKLTEFINVNDIFYLGIWYFECDKKHFKKLKQILAFYEKSKIVFDRKFELKKDNNMYCSEFVINVLNKLKLFNYLPYTKKLKPIAKEILNKETLIYYPVDLFLSDIKIKQLYVKTIK